MVAKPSKTERLETILRIVPGLVRASALLKPAASGEQAESAPQDSPCCVSGGMVDTQDLRDNRPLQGHLRGFARV